jgi:hypothetical protein
MDFFDLVPGRPVGGSIRLEILRRVNNGSTTALDLDMPVKRVSRS